MDERTPEVGASQDAGSYDIRVSGALDARWASWFDGMNVRTRDDGTSLISGPIADQAALHGVLQRVRDVGLALISVERRDPGTSSLDPIGNRTTRRPTE